MNALKGLGDVHLCCQEERCKEYGKLVKVKRLDWLALCVLPLDERLIDLAKSNDYNLRYEKLSVRDLILCKNCSNGLAERTKEQQDEALEGLKKFMEESNKKSEDIKTRFAAKQEELKRKMSKRDDADTEV